jgi:hypothetical protein
MREFYIIIDQDDDRELAYKPTQHSYLLDMIAEMQPHPKWEFENDDYRVTVYAIALYHMPVGEDREEIEHRIMMTLGLI